MLLDRSDLDSTKLMHSGDRNYKHYRNSGFQLNSYRLGLCMYYLCLDQIYLSYVCIFIVYIVYTHNTFSIIICN